MLIDQDTKVDGVWVPFFGRPAFTPVGAAKIASASSAPPWSPSSSSACPTAGTSSASTPRSTCPDDPQEATALMTAKIEEQIRRHPEQWVWMHRRWRRQPAPEVSP